MIAAAALALTADYQSGKRFRSPIESDRYWLDAGK
jgi:hypothetical protein